MASRNDRIEMRLSRDQKSLIQDAAALSGQDVTSFAVSTLLERAQQVIETKNRITLGHRSMKSLIRLLESDREPTPALRAAVKRWKQQARVVR